jgi:hypothetical protein
VTAVVVASAHAGTICTRPPCIGSNAATPGDYLAAARLPDGRLVAVVTTDPEDVPAALGDAGASPHGRFVVAVQEA